ncbi:MAG TPA: hypothetical protein VGU74_01690 [Gemmatimonadales bacterium]|nr:hypothetical protein [Gemmatimonadales bacterium]
MARRLRELSTTTFRAVVFLGLLAASSPAQKTIIISDSLAANSDRLKVNNPAQWLGRIPGWRFGDYAVGSSKGGATETATHRNLFDTKSQSHTTERFSFVLTNKTTDSAMVDALRNSDVDSLKGLQLGNGWSIGREAVVESGNFSAIVTINGDTTGRWGLFLGIAADSGYAGFLTNGDRRISVALASSNRDPSDLRGPPAIGFEFVEGGRSVGAVQYFGGSNALNRFVWIDRSLDARTKLILAAAMTAILQANRL